MPLIELRGLTKHYQMGDTLVHALDGVDLNIEKGEFIAITGASGSGKSTMMHLLGCLDRPTRGTYMLEHQNVSQLSDRELAAIRNRYIGFVFQTFNLINRTSAAENVGIPLFYARQGNTLAPALAALERVGLGPRARHNPNELSGGERQRVAIARAIVNNPVLLLADEPTGNLDSKTGKQIMRIFHELSEQGVTIVLVTHEPEVAEQARRIVQMRDGQVISDRPTARPRGPAPADDPTDDGDRDEAAASAATAAPEPAPPANTSPLPEGSGPIPGANATLSAGLLAGASLAVAIGCFWYNGARAAAIKAAGVVPTGPQDMPRDLVMAGAIGIGCVLVGLLAGALAVYWGSGVRRQIASSSARWRGRGRVLLGTLCGWAAILIPAGYLGFKLVNRMQG